MANTKGTTSAGVAYAQAIMDLAGDKADQLGQELADLAQLMQQDELIRRFMVDPAISPGQRWDALRKSLEARCSELCLKAVGVLTERGRLSLIPEIAAAYARLLDVRHNRVRVEVTVAHRLDDAHVAVVRDRVSKALHKDAIIQQKVDDSIIGGLVLKFGDKLIDGSVKAQLNAMKKQLLGATVNG